MAARVTGEEASRLLAQANSQLPHGPGMRLVDGLIDFDTREIHCRAHIQPGNPLLDQQQLHPLICLEYAAQAAAIHGILINKGFTANQPAYVGAIKECHWQHGSPAVRQTLLITATAEYLADEGAIYGFSVAGEDGDICRGRMTLVRR